ncbi:dihydropyrimidinase [Roseibacterium sp. SDUM158017]|uniref:dihydropyrimidinase n=1 Tax=Roseicyclus salinarum TaxID=3036773 RepID=UPI002415566C|nr:dihydropyrimidinase [Roseibacterium sp. SDUM158017]MDG4647747.1 dihydropyrimidinase [Roseibacterium sp. SDUM158017]
MVWDLVIRGGRVVTPDTVTTTDIAVSEGRIAAVGRGLEAARTIDADGLIVTPGGVDPHCHIEQMSGMGLMNADTFETATRSAAMGGTTSLISFAAQSKGQRLSEAAADYAARAARGAAVDHAFHLILADPGAPDFEADLETLIAAGHRSLKVFTTYNIGLDDAGILRALKIAGRAGALTCIHAENDAIIAEARARLLAEGRTRPLDHAASRPRAAEIEAVARMCRLAEAVRAPVMIFHVSTAEAAAEIRAARARGAPVWAETCPHYLFQTEEVLDRPGLEGAKWMCSPPQRLVADQEALWQALALGDLQVVSSDHAPYRHDGTGKLSAGPDAAFPAIANGMPGLEVRLPLMFDAMVSRGRLGLSRFAELTSAAPARLYGLATKGRIAPGMDADLVLWDPAREHTYGEDDLHDNVGYNPWAGTTVRGWPQRVILRGETVVEEGSYLGTPGTGRWLPRASVGTIPADLTGRPQ